MLNAVGREIPDEILEITGKEPFQGNNYKEGVEYRKQGPIVKTGYRSQYEQDGGFNQGSVGEMWCS